MDSVRFPFIKSRPNPLPQPTGAGTSVFGGLGRFVAPRLRRSLALRRLWLREVVRPHSHTYIMKKHIALGLVASTLFLAGCCTSHHATTADALPAGSVRLVVDDAVKDETFRIASLKVLSLQPGRFSVGMEGGDPNDGRAHGGRAYGDFLASATDKLQEGRVLFVASRATDSRTTNAYILVGFQAMAKGGDGGMWFQSSVLLRQSCVTAFRPPR